MASEITLNATLQVINGQINSKLSKVLRVDQTTAGAVQRTQSITTSDTVLVLTGVTTPRALAIVNLSDEFSVKIGATVAGAIAPLGRLGPGEIAMIPLEPAAVVRCQGVGGTCVVDYLVLET